MVDMAIRENLDALGSSLQSQVLDPVARMWNPDLTSVAKSFVDEWRDELARHSTALRLAFDNYDSKTVGTKARELASKLAAASEATNAAKQFMGQTDKATIDVATGILDQATVALTRWYAEVRQFDAELLDPSSTFIDLVETELEAQRFPAGLHEVSEGNEIRLIDTPGVWGRAMTEAGVGASAAAAVQSLADTLYFMVARATFKVDILSLNPPGGVFLDALFRALTDLARNVEAMGATVVVRLLFGWVPTRDTVSEFVTSLAGLCRTERFPLDRMTVVVGQYHAYKGTWWNHAKIVAVDESKALVGGHDLWDAPYGQYPPVHDVSVLVSGKAAGSAQRFAEFLWQRAGEYLVVKQIDSNYAVRTLEPGIARDQCVLPREFELADASQRQLSLQVTDPFSVGVWKSGRVLSLGRAGGLVDRAYNASDVAKQLLVRHARHSLRICQQDLLFLGAAAKQDHLVCQWIADALVENTGLTVQIIVSPIDGSGAGEPYSWGSGAAGTFDFLCELVEERVGTSRAVTVLRRLCVAPLAFTDAVPGHEEAFDYVWPNVPKKVWAGRFGTSVPAPSLSTYPPAPGNHAKVFMVDDSAYVVGSDNLHPHNLAEFSYLVEGPAVGEFIHAYWARVWGYSEALCVSTCCAVHNELEHHEEIFPL